MKRKVQPTVLVITVRPGSIEDVKRIRDANPGMSLREAWEKAGRPGVRCERVVEVP